jgi:hypothetical protein
MDADAFWRAVQHGAEEAVIGANEDGVGGLHGKRAASAAHAGVYDGHVNGAWGKERSGLRQDVCRLLNGLRRNGMCDVYRITPFMAAT